MDKKNIVTLKHGGGVPPLESLADYELTFSEDNKALYLKKGEELITFENSNVIQEAVQKAVDEAVQKAVSEAVSTIQPNLRSITDSLNSLKSGEQKWWYRTPSANSIYSQVVPILSCSVGKGNFLIIAQQTASISEDSLITTHLRWTTTPTNGATLLNLFTRSTMLSGGGGLAIGFITNPTDEKVKFEAVGHGYCNENYRLEVHMVVIKINDRVTEGDF